MCEPNLEVKADEPERNELKVAAQERDDHRGKGNNKTKNKLHDFFDSGILLLSFSNTTTTQAKIV